MWRLSTTSHQWTVLLLLLFSILNQYQSVTGNDLIIRQRLSSNTTISQIVKGLATYIVNTDYYFDCTSVTYGGPGGSLVWQRDGDSLGGSQSGISGGAPGIRFSFFTPAMDREGIYICRHNATVLVSLMITTTNPAVQSMHKNITVLAGNNVSIEFYASSEPFITSSDITWSFNKTLITAASSNKYNFIFDNRILSIQSVEASDDGEYNITVKDSVSATTRLIVLTPPSFIAHPLTPLSLSEWNMFTLNCTVTGSTDNIQWYRSNGSALPDGHVIHTMSTNAMLTSVLTVPDARVADSGAYYCSASFTDGTNSTSSNESIVNITGGIRNLYFPEDDDVVSNVTISSLLLYTLSPSFHIQCQGSGDLTWINSNGEPVSSLYTSVPHQSSTGILNFTHSPMNGELYTCVSDSGANGSVFVTSDNPAIYTPSSTILITSSTDITTASIRVYVDGSDPPPSPNNITWYHNDQLIPPNSTPSYMLTSNNTVLVIRGQGSSLIGSYTVRVMTTNGDSSVIVNVTYPDSLIVNIEGPHIIREGDDASLYCNITNLLPMNNISLSWYFITNNGTETLLQTEEPLLMIDNARQDSSGFYVCSVTDDVGTTNQSTKLLVEYPPSASIINITSNNISLPDGSVMTLFHCTSDGSPSPNITWTYNNSTRLPNGIDQNNGLLNWTRPVVYTDEGLYACVSANDVGRSVAVINISIYASPNIYSIYSPHPGSLVSITNALQFNCPMSNNCNLSCITRGWPRPTVEWKDGNGRRLQSHTITSERSDVIEAVVSWSSTVVQYRCEASNIHGSKTINVSLTNDGTTTAPAPPPPPTPSSEATSAIIRLHLSTIQCSQRDSIPIELISSLSYIIRSSCSYCSYELNGIATGCTDNQSTIAVLNITSSSHLLPTYAAVSYWWTQGPTILIDQDLVPVATDCDLLAEGLDPISCTPTLTSSSTVASTLITTVIPTASPTKGTNVGPIVAFIITPIAIILILLVIVIGLCLFCYFCNKNKEKSNQVDCDLTGYNTNADDKIDGSGFLQDTSFNKGESEYASIQLSSVLRPSLISTNNSPPQSSPLPVSPCPAPPAQYEELNVILPYSEVTTLQRQLLQAKNSNTATCSGAKNSNGDASPTKRVTQVQVIGSSNGNINNNDYQLPFEHHQYATLTESSATIERPSTDSRLTRSVSPYVEPVPVPSANGLSTFVSSPYMEPVNSTGDLRASPASPPVSPYEEPVNSIDDLTTPPHIEPLPTNERSLQHKIPPIDSFVIIDSPANNSNDITSPTPAWYNSCYEDIVTPTGVKDN